jgi:hypothetical protein
VRETLTRDHVQQFFEDAAWRELEYARTHKAEQLLRIADSVADVPDDLLSDYLGLMVDNHVADRLVELQLGLCAAGHLSEARSAACVPAAVVGEGQRLQGRV